MQGIFTGLDWYSAIFTDTSVSSVLAWIGLDPDVCSDEFFVTQHERTCNFDDIIVFSYNNVNVEVRQAYFYGRNVDLSVFDLIVPRIRLDISGQGLAFLRGYLLEKGVILDDHLRSEADLMPGQHVTRCDFSFDFVNYKPELLDDLISYIGSNRTESDRLVIMNKTSATIYKIKTGSEKTVYIGSSQSDKLLRVYDKKLQFTDSTGKFYIKDDPYEHPESWIRVEWQLRNAWASRILFAEYQDPNKNMLSVLKEIYKEYNFADLSTPAHRRVAHAFWQNIFDDWDEIGSIIQNFYYTQEKVRFYDKVVDGYPRWMNHFIYLVSLLGWDKFKSLVDDWLHDMQHFDSSSNPIHNQKRWRNFVNHLNELGLKSDRLYSPNNPLFMNVEGDLVFNVKGSGMK